MLLLDAISSVVSGDNVLYYVGHDENEECSSVLEVRKWVGGDEKLQGDFESSPKFTSEAFPIK